MYILRQFTLIFSVISSGLCCYYDWFANNGSCYKVIQYQTDYNMARRYCETINGDLAYVSSKTSLKFLNTLKTFDGMHSYWLKEKSSTNPTSTSAEGLVPNSCPYARVLDIETSACDEQKPFICERPDTQSQNCLPGWELYGSMCYKPSLIVANYTDSVKYCSLQRGQLAVVDSIEKENSAKAFIMGSNHSYYVGAKLIKDSAQWSNGKPFEPSCESCVHLIRDQGEQCITIYSPLDHPLLVSWSTVHCDIKLPFLCEMPVLATTTTKLSTAPTTPAPLQCPHGNNWKAHEDSGYCFWETTYETERLNWYQARAFCQAYGGDLASYDDLSQESVGLSGAVGHYKGLWIGLKRGDDDVFRWSDGNTLKYTNWDYHEPDLRGRTRFCVTHGAVDSKWELDYCGVRRWFVCKSPKVRGASLIPEIEKTKKIPCNVSDWSVYRSQWFLYGDHCYMVHEVAKYTWETARTFCEDNNAHMASIHSFNETNFVLFAESISPDTDFWIGLSARGLDSTLEWSDGTPLDFQYWFADNNFNASEHNIENCIAFRKRDGAWVFSHCNLLLGVICKRSLTSNPEFSTTVPTTQLPGNCPKEWYPYGSSCYKPFGKEYKERTSWADAAKECENLKAKLVSIHSQDQQDFLIDLLLELRGDTWIGLMTASRGSEFKWEDGSRIYYTNWAQLEPLYQPFLVRLTDFEHDYEGTKEYCVQMAYDKEDMGKWSVQKCRKEMSYICEKQKDANILEPSLQPFSCENITGWLKLDSSCYGVFESPGEERTWLGAQSTCRHYGANLVTYKNAGTTIFLKRRIARKNGLYWTAVRQKLNGKLEHVTGKPIVYSNWMRGQPHTSSNVIDNCVSSNSDGYWIVRSCQEKHPFICEWEREAEKKVPVKQSSSECPKILNWLDFGLDSCYLMRIHQLVNWNRAVSFCFQHGGFLASIHSQQEVSLITDYALNNSMKRGSLYIGLGQRHDGSFAWMDHSPLDIIKWDEGEPSDLSFDCVKMSVIDGKWSSVECTTLMGFICTAPKIKTSNKEKFVQEPSPDNTVVTKLTAGGIVGIIICILVILAIVGFVIYYMYFSQGIQSSLLQSETSE